MAASGRPGPPARTARWPGPLFAGLGLAAAVFGGAGAAAADDTTLGQAAAAEAPAAIQEVRRWVLATGDNEGQPFVIVDKLDARVAAFDRAGAMIALAPILLGLATGDDSPAGIGDRPLADIGPLDRITPAGRFLAQLGENLGGKTVLWVDYEAAISLHPVVTTLSSEHRLARLDSPTTSDNRISYGCINVPVAFYSAVILPLFHDTPGLVYVLPETRSLEDEFFRRDRAAAAGPDRLAAMPPV